MTQEDREAYEAYLDRLSMPPCPIKISDDEISAYNSEHPLPSENDVNRILREAQT